MRRTALAITAACVALGATLAVAQDRPETPPWTEEAPRPGAAQTARPPRVALAWNRWYHVPELEKAARDLAAAFPDLVEVRTIGKSVEGRDLTMMVVTDRATGADTAKPGFWADGNIHGNEVQGAETCLYLVWWLCEHRDLPRVADLLRTTALYVVPTINPDGRARWLDEPGTMHSSRGGSRPVDNDRDGLFDEDGPDDLDGDGEILEMRVACEDGDMVPDPLEPRLMVRAKPGERGRWRLIGSEGLDDDGDGRFNEDGPGGYDPNRDWPTTWRPPAEQSGAQPYPCSLPETRAVVEFLSSHPNVAGFQSFHNNGGMILRSPGAQAFGVVPPSDDRVLRAIAARGEEQLPFYRSMVIWKDLYQVYGGSVDFAYGGLGILSFTNELWNPDQYRQRARPDRRGEHDDAGGGPDDGSRGSRARERLRFDDDLELSGRWVAWHTVRHPQLGDVELGGWRRDTGRVPPPFMTEEMLHRNAMFVVFHASALPRVTAGGVRVTPLGGGLFAVDATFRNEGRIPTRSGWAARQHLGADDRVTCAGDGVTVVSAGVVDAATGRVDAPETRRPAELRLAGGIAGDSGVAVRFVVRGAGRVRVGYAAEKGGNAAVEADLR